MNRFFNSIYMKSIGFLTHGPCGVLRIDQNVKTIFHSFYCRKLKFYLNVAPWLQGIEGIPSATRYYNWMQSKSFPSITISTNKQLCYYCSSIRLNLITFSRFHSSTIRVQYFIFTYTLTKKSYVKSLFVIEI